MFAFYNGKHCSFMSPLKFVNFCPHAEMKKNTHVYETKGIPRTRTGHNPIALSLNVNSTER